MNFTIILPKNAKSTPLAYLLENVWLVPRKQRHFLRTRKGLFVNGQVATDWSVEVGPGDTIMLAFEASDFGVKPVVFGDASLVDVLYEDDHLIIVNKPEGMKTHGNDPGEIGLLNHVSAYCGITCFVIHRLDTDTSGAIVFAKNPFVLPILNQMLEARQIHRQYVALCQGHFNRKSFTINQPLGRDRHDRRKQVVTPSGKRAVTHVSLVRSIGRNDLVECVLDTGRTHQIRVHLSHAGHAIIGDPLYGKVAAPRLMLHARQLSLVHPFSGEEVLVEARSATFDVGLGD
jgi:23S rRNA pseudouridine1911/1915/1917 synthase